MAFRLSVVAIVLAAVVLFVSVSSADDPWEYCGNVPADVVFLLDSSSSIWGPDFRRMIKFVEDVVSMFQIGPNATRVGLVTYNDNIDLQFNLKRYLNRDSLMRAIRNVKESQGYSTATDLAIKYARTYMFLKKGGGRPGVSKVVVVITDGKSRDLIRTLMEASLMKRQGVHLFAIGVDQAVNEKELSRMASEPSSEYFFHVAGYSALDSLKKVLAIKTCKVTNPPTLRTTTPATSSTTTTTTTTVPPTTTSATTTERPATSPSTEPPTTSTTEPPTTTTTEPTTTTTTPTTTTTTATTTTTLPRTTTTTWVDVVRRECNGKMADIVFALDNSDAVDHADFWQMIRFVRDFARGLDIRHNGTRIGLVLYSEMVQHGFDLNEHDTIHSVVSHLYKMQMSSGVTRPEEMLRYVRTKSFRRSVSRKGAAQVVIILTASSSKHLYKTKKEALKAQRMGLTFLVVGVGNKVNDEELRILTGYDPAADHSSKSKSSAPSPSMDSDMAMMMNELLGGEGGPGEGGLAGDSENEALAGLRRLEDQHILTPAPSPTAAAAAKRPVFRLDTFRQLESVLLDLVLQACAAEPTDNPVSDQPCGTRQEADLMFVVDSANAGKKNTKKALDFVSAIAGEMQIDRDKIQLGLLSSEPEDPCEPSRRGGNGTASRRHEGNSSSAGSAHPGPAAGFGLNEFRSKENLVESLSTDEDSAADFADLIKDLRRNAFRHKAGARKGAKKVAILLVDGDLDDPLTSVSEAQSLRDRRGVEIYVISVGTHQPQPEMMMMCDYPIQQHFYHVDSYDRLDDMKGTLVDILCDDL